MKVFNTLKSKFFLTILTGSSISYCLDYDVRRYDTRQVKEFMVQMEKEFGSEPSWRHPGPAREGCIRTISNCESSGWVLVVDEPARKLPEKNSVVSEFSE